MSSLSAGEELWILKEAPHLCNAIIVLISSGNSMTWNQKQMEIFNSES